MPIDLLQAGLPQFVKDNISEHNKAELNKRGMPVKGQFDIATGASC